MCMHVACSGGSDWRTIKVMRIDQASGKGEDLSDVLEHVKFSSMAWTHDNKACPPQQQCSPLSIILRVHAEGATSGYQKQ